MRCNMNFEKFWETQFYGNFCQKEDTIFLWWKKELPKMTLANNVRVIEIQKKTGEIVLNSVFSRTLINNTS